MNGGVSFSIWRKSGDVEKGYGSLEIDLDMDLNKFYFKVLLQIWCL